MRPCLYFFWVGLHRKHPVILSLKKRSGKKPQLIASKFFNTICLPQTLFILALVMFLFFWHVKDCCGSLMFALFPVSKKCCGENQNLWILNFSLLFACATGLSILFCSGMLFICHLPAGMVYLFLFVWLGKSCCGSLMLARPAFQKFYMASRISLIFTTCSENACIVISFKSLSTGRSFTTPIYRRFIYAQSGCQRHC